MRPVEVERTIENEVGIARESEDLDPLVVSRLVLYLQDVRGLRPAARARSACLDDPAADELRGRAERCPAGGVVIDDAASIGASALLIVVRVLRTKSGRFESAVKSSSRMTKLRFTTGLGRRPCSNALVLKVTVVSTTTGPS